MKDERCWYVVSHFTPSQRGKAWRDGVQWRWIIEQRIEGPGQTEFWVASVGRPGLCGCAGTRKDASKQAWEALRAFSRVTSGDREVGTVPWKWVFLFVLLGIVGAAIEVVNVLALISVLGLSWIMVATVSPMLGAGIRDELRELGGELRDAAARRDRGRA